MALINVIIFIIKTTNSVKCMDNVIFNERNLVLAHSYYVIRYLLYNKPI